MTKNQELEILDTAIRSLGPDSYLGPWLAQMREGIEMAIRCDMFPEITPKQAAAGVASIKAEAQREADHLRSLAAKDRELAGRELATVKAEAGRIREAMLQATDILRRAV